MRVVRAPLLLLIGWIVLVPLLSACRYAPTSEERKTVEAMTLDMQTWGMGRHLIDLPRTWRYGGGDVTLYFGLGTDFKTVQVRVVGEGVSQGVFKNAVDERASLIGKVTNDKSNASMLVLKQPLEGGGFLLRYFDGTTSTNYHKHEVHILVDDVYLALLADSFEGVIAPVESRLKLLATQIHKVVHPERAGAGFVLGPVIIGGNHDHEDGTLYFYDAQRRDFKLEVGISAVTPDEPVRLSQRDVEVFGITRRAYLREGSISLAGMVGEEALLGYENKDAEENSYRQLLFVAESYRKKPGFLTPSIDLRLTGGGKRRRVIDPGLRDLASIALPTFARIAETGNTAPSVPADPSLSDYEAIGLWDAIIKSIRPRASAVAAPPEFKTSVYLDPEKVEAEKRILDDWLNSLPLPPDGTKG